METVRSFPYQVEEREHVLIPMSDGVRLAARMWIPHGAKRNPVPAILEYIPYRKRDGTRRRDQLQHPYFAGHGYAAVRVDLRGSGDSEGLLMDEYLEQELADGEEVLCWLAAQPWCDGNVGMIGKSWGGFNALQLAARRPPELKAVISVCSSDDRYADDVHYMGGCLLGDNLSWASTMFAYTSLPPDPRLVGERWREMWLERLDASHHWLDTWLQHQWRDEYWKWGSIIEDFSRVECPVLVASGWADGYSNSVFRILEGLEGPRMGILGPWSHRYPHLGMPGPPIGFLQEALRWWGRWLKGEETGIMQEPMLRAWRQDTVSPFTSYEERPGAWIGETTWPSDRIGERRYHLVRGCLVLSRTGTDEAISVQSPLTLGLYGGKWCSYSGGPDLPEDQRLEDGGSIVFDSEPLSEPMDIVGRPRVQLDIAADRPAAMVAVRLSEILPNGEATRVTYGLLNLAHRDSHEAPEPMEPGRFYPVEVLLNGIAQRFSPGSRLRIAISSSYWPIAWLPPQRTTLTIRTGGSALVLPERPTSLPGGVNGFEAPEAAPPIRTQTIEPSRRSWIIRRDLAQKLSVLEVTNDDGVFRFPRLDLTVKNSAVETYSVRGDDVDSARGETVWVKSFQRGDWKVETVTRTVLTSTATHFELEAELDAYEGARRVRSRNWHRRIPRRLV